MIIISKIDEYIRKLTIIWLEIETESGLSATFKTLGDFLSIMQALWKFK